MNFVEAHVTILFWCWGRVDNVQIKKRCESTNGINNGRSNTLFAEDKIF